MATLEKWAPLPDLDIVERRMRRFFDELGVGRRDACRRRRTTPAAELVVELDVPGFDERTSPSPSPITR